MNKSENVEIYEKSWKFWNFEFTQILLALVHLAPHFFTLIPESTAPTTAPLSESVGIRYPDIQPLDWDWI